MFLRRKENDCTQSIAGNIPTCKSHRFRIIGYVDIAPNGDKTLRNEKFQILGYYKANRDVTQDARFMIVG